jgi:hypothetical protein
MNMVFKLMKYNHLNKSLAKKYFHGLLNNNQRLTVLFILSFQVNEISRYLICPKEVGWRRSDFRQELEDTDSPSIFIYLLSTPILHFFLEECGDVIANRCKVFQLYQKGMALVRHGRRESQPPIWGSSNQKRFTDTKNLLRNPLGGERGYALWT